MKLFWFCSLIIHVIAGILILPSIIKTIPDAKFDKALWINMMAVFGYFFWMLTAWKGFRHKEKKVKREDYETLH